MAEYLSPKLDIVAKMIFVRNTQLLGDFLLSVLDINEDDIHGIEILNPFVAADDPEEKKSIMDIKLKLKSGHRVNVEVSLRRDYQIAKRLQYYKSRMVTEQLSTGDEYGEKVATSYVAVLDYIMFDDAWCHHSFSYHDKKHDAKFPANEDIHILELPKREQEKDNQALWCWLQFFSATEKEEFEMLSGQNDVMKQAVNVLANLSADDAARILAEAREKEMRDQKSRESGARKEGIEEAKRNIARNMLKAGYPADDIVKLTGLSASDIEGLLS